MARTKARSAIVIIMCIILAAVVIGVIEYKVISSHFTNKASTKSPAETQSGVSDVQPDGTIRFQSTMETINTTGRMLDTEHFINSDFVHVERITDELGQPIKFTTQHEGNIYRYVATLNKPVPPGSKYSLIMEGTETGLIKPTGELNVYEYRMVHYPATGSDTRRVEVHRLPPRAVLLEKFPADLKETTKNGQIELRIDKIIPPGGSIEVSYRYRLAAN